jgi:hypothetical protein
MVAADVNVKEATVGGSREVVKRGGDGGHRVRSRKLGRRRAQGVEA